jgi:transglutaminase-like putative cysteine protease
MSKRPRYGGGSPAERARAIYDWVVENVEYKKVGTGWGNGDTFWACSERYGNCTDFHALFISLARTEGIPARFEMGFPVPDSRPSGEIGG